MAKHSRNCQDTKIIEGIFGIISSTDINDQIDRINNPITIKSYTMINKNRMEVVLISWGATIVSIKCPDKYGEFADIVLGFDELESYMNPDLNQFIGCVLGRCANRIKEGRCWINKEEFHLTINDGKHHLNGGCCGFDKKIWNSQIDDCTVVMTYLSADGEEGYPGAVLVTLRFKLTVDNKLEINMRANTSKPTVINLSHGSYFNLAGHDAGEEEMRKHTVTLNCDRWTFADHLDPIPTGSIRSVGGTVMDLRIPRVIGEYIEKVPTGEGYDHNFCVVRNCQTGMTFVARIVHPQNGRVLEVYSDQPGIQFNTGGCFPTSINAGSISTETLDANAFDNLASYTSFAIEDEQKQEENEEELNYWPNKELEIIKEIQNVITKPLGFIPGKNGAHYNKYGAFSVQPQNYPNAVNIKHFPCCILRPGQVYSHDLVYKFGIQLANSI